MDAFAYHSYVRGHHVYQTNWAPIIGETLFVQREHENHHDLHAVAVRKGDEIVGHVPRGISRVTAYFLARESSSVECEVTGPGVNRGVGHGLEVPCMYRFSGKKSHIKRLKELLLSKTK